MDTVFSPTLQRFIAASGALFLLLVAVLAPNYLMLLLPLAVVGLAALADTVGEVGRLRGEGGEARHPRGCEWAAREPGGEPVEVDSRRGRKVLQCGLRQAAVARLAQPEHTHALRHRGLDTLPRGVDWNRLPHRAFATRLEIGANDCEAPTYHRSFARASAATHLTQDFASSPAPARHLPRARRLKGARNQAA